MELRIGDKLFDSATIAEMMNRKSEAVFARSLLMALPGNQRLCKYALAGKVSHRLCTQLFKCSSCEFDQMVAAPPLPRTTNYDWRVGAGND